MPPTKPKIAVDAPQENVENAQRALNRFPPILIDFVETFL
jgi:hypothetical protein